MTATPEQQKQASRKLNQWIQNEQKIVTFRELAREVGCHLNTAKNLLNTHLSTLPRPIPTYLLTGPLLQNSKLATTQLDSLSQIPVQATQKVRIVDMDERSEDERDSQDGLEDDEEVGLLGFGEGRGVLGEGAGNDEGDREGIGGGFGVKIEGKGMDGEGGEGEGEGVRGEEVGRWGVVLALERDLEEKIGLFDKGVEICVYALSPAVINDPAQYLLPSLSLRSHSSYHNPTLYGTYTGTPLSAGVGTKTLKDGAMGFGGPQAKDKDKGKKDDGKATTTITAAAAMKSEVQEDIKPKIPTESTSTKAEMAKAGSSKAQLSTTNTEPSKSKPSSTKAKPTPEPEAESSSSKAIPKPSQKKKRIIHSDHEDAPNPAPAPPASETPEISSSMVRAEDKAAMEAMMGMGMDEDVDMGGGEDTEGDDEEELSSRTETVKEMEKERGKEARKSGGGRKSIGGGEENRARGGGGGGDRKRRKVKKSRVEIDAKGYTVTKDYFTDESYSGSENDVPDIKPDLEKVKAKPVPVPKKPVVGRNDSGEGGKKVGTGGGGGSGGAGGGGKKGGQTSLQGFFKKK